MSEYRDRMIIDSSTAKDLVCVRPEVIPYNNDFGESVMGEYVGQLNGWFSDIKKYSDLDYCSLVSGETMLSYRMPQSQKVKIDSVMGEYRYPVTIHRANGVSTPLNTGVDLNRLIINYPDDRYKFYLSLDATTPSKSMKATSFFRELVQRCKDEKVSILAKVWDHDYDNPDIFTWQPVTMSRILQELYSNSKFSGIWFNTRHFFQKPIKGVSPDHIGLVNEPIYGLKGVSHSGRMSALGEFVDDRIAEFHNGGSIGVLTFYDAAKKAGVEPTQPWRVNRRLLDDNKRCRREIWPDIKG